MHTSATGLTRESVTTSSPAVHSSKGLSGTQCSPCHKEGIRERDDIHCAGDRTTGERATDVRVRGKGILSQSSFKQRNDLRATGLRYLVPYTTSGRLYGSRALSASYPRKHFRLLSEIVHSVFGGSFMTLHEREQCREAF